MIGQVKLKNQVANLISTGFPRFTIICGAKSSGKKLFAASIGKQLGAHTIFVGTKVDEIRSIIDLAYKQSEPTLYVIADADKMSVAAKNALLKITEEPPRKAYFIMTLEDINNTLGTLKSRGSVLNINPYAPLDLEAYSNYRNYDLTDDELEIVFDLCTVPGDVDTLMRYNVSEFYNYVVKVVENIGQVSGANAFKILNKLSFKQDDGLWDIPLFMRAVMSVCLQKYDETGDSAYPEMIKATSQYLGELAINGIHKQSTMDMWVLAMREPWMGV